MSLSSPAPGPIVSSAHLASGALPVLSEFEFGLILVSHAFQRWMVRAMAAAGLPDLSAIDVLVLHSVQHRSKAKRLADLCFVLNIEDTHVVSYSVKKLERLKFVSSHRQGKEKFISATPAGTKACERYKAIREALLVQPVASLGLDEASMSRIAAQMRTLSGYYDQAARAAASL
ncbi:winged helix DNA-binding protein [Rhodoligotrophos ferricapiens]|uniref:winged helix DNA-binding protein n=1 Tax=Rhodoligotrophos ferricapiens TaxID=3069264 RepID=UPI00315C538D